MRYWTYELRTAAVPPVLRDGTRTVPYQVKSSYNTPVMQGANQMHIKRRCDCELPRQSCRLGRACVYIFDSGPALVMFGAPTQRKCEGGVGIRDARVKVHPVNWLTQEAQDPETQPHFVHSGGSDSCTAFPRKILRTAFGKQLPCGRLILTHRSHIKRRRIKVFKAHSSEK